MTSTSPEHIQLHQPMAVDQNVNADEELLLPVSKDDESSDRHNLIRLGASFFLFGLINNVLYVVILSAALDLVPPATPKGIIAFCNIAPALLAKILWPYLLKGRIRYTRRIIGCCVLSVTGMVFVAAFEGLGHRLFGICLASLSSGLGELTFLQLSTTYPVAASGHAVGYFASGTGGAGVAGAALWWEVRGLGVTKGVAVSAFLPFVTPLTYFFLLPASAMFQGTLAPSSAYTAIPTADPNDASDEEADQTQRTPNSPVETHHRKRLKVSLTPSDKLRLVKPLFWRFMFPLFCVYTIEYTINQGIAPTLIFPVPDRSTHWLLSTFIKSLRDYYPLWQLIYQIFVFFSRSSISVGLPALPTRLLGLPAMVQSVILITLALESAVGILPDNVGVTIPIVMMLIAVEGVCGGLAYVNVFYRIGQENHPEETDDEYSKERKKQEREFKIGSIGLSDSMGILLASMLAVPTELELCKAQVRRGKMFCKTL